MRLEDIKVGQLVECNLAGWRPGQVTAVNEPNRTFPNGYVQADVEGFVWLGSPEQVREVPPPNGWTMGGFFDGAGSNV